ncbi:hypothetical protein CP533_5274 [Ophiocordyceps camponoti-saundersi (nom. inval.)]|nr:hypothetical protein CP533_5274 [Ophiocordyceps camponoti-saundersi (nom. inval.)]
MPRREQCDGQDPCERCSRSGRQCLFSSNQHESKDALRAEIERLRCNNERSNALLDAVSSPNHLGMLNMMAQRLNDNRNDSRHAMLLDFATRIRNTSREKRPVSTLPPPVLCASSDERGVDSTAASLPPTPSSIPISQPLARTETQTALKDVAHIRQLVQSLATWDYMPFCLLNKDLFLEDLASGGTRYCSPALVNALVDLATRMKEGSNGNVYSNKTLTMIRDSAGHLPDSQALGVFALYQLLCGREGDARNLASSFVTAVSQLRQLKPSLNEDGSHNEHEEYNQVIDASYCGAVSLVRILALTTLRPINASDDLTQDDGIFLDQLARRAVTASQSSLHEGKRQPEQDSPRPRASRTDEISEEGGPSNALSDDDLQMMPARIFQLFEWVYKSLAFKALTSPESISWSRVLAAYKRCLDWYGSFFAMPRTSAGDSPFVLFVHIFYQFCLLRLFWPFVSKTGGEADACAREICLQAAQSILRLSESYANIFGLSRVSPLVAYFVFASAQFSLAVEEAGHGVMNTVSVRDEASSQAKSGSRVDEALSPLTPPTPHVLMSMVAHARLLLDEMSETHPVAAVAESLLRAKLLS